MKIFRKIVLCFFAIFCLVFPLTACGSKEAPQTPSANPSETPPVSEEWVSESLTFEQYGEFLSLHSHSLGNSYRAEIANISSSGETENFVQLVAVDSNGGVSASLVGEEYSSYILGDNVYFNDGTQKVYEKVDTCKASASKCGEMYRLINSLVAPGELEEYHIYDGTFFESIRDAYGLKNANAEDVDHPYLNENWFTLTKTYNSTVTYISVSFSPDENTITTFTLAFQKGTFDSILISRWVSGETSEIKLTATTEQITFPNFNEYLPYTGDEEVEA